MNDFTKEELGYIYDELDSNYSELKNIPLMNKVKAIIDNYCDHPENMSMYSLGEEYCVKCKRKLND